ncbi:MAG: AMP-binding protein [Candidatus Delongbacteria bacterium]|nr:AMP-binding protein [Candidatus Delongbacteria bacterium]MBN2834224.1 AMP-binding protein [Candidatus Delongbacteria bacterium]
MELLHHKFIDIVNKNRQKVAIHDVATGKDLSYEKILIGSFIMASNIKKSASHYIGIMVPNSAGCILTILGTLFAGKIPVMINYSTGAINNCKYAMDFVGFDTVYTSSKLLEKLNIEKIENMICLEDIISSVGSFTKIKAALKSKMAFQFAHKPNPDTPAVILFTSGSEKNPKAVVLSHENILHNLEGIQNRLKVTSDDTFLGVLPLFHVFGLTTTFWLPLTIGSSLVAVPNPLEYSRVAELAKKYRPGAMTATPAFFHNYNLKSNQGDFSSLKFAVSGGDKLSDKIFDDFYDKHKVKLLEGYGTTETAPVISTNSPEIFKKGSIGKPLANIEVKIVSLETDDVLPNGKIGKILVKGGNVMSGYLYDQEETSYRIHRGWYDTGDMGVMDKDGYLHHHGRLKRFVKIAGEMISLPNIEYYAEKCICSNCLCCAVDIPHPVKGSEIWLCIAGEFDEKRLKKDLMEYLPNISLPKKYIKFKEFPMMGNGKVNFREVANLCKKMLRH